MIERALSSILHFRLKQYPGVLLTGARQVGKTTLARSLGGIYYDLEQESDRLRLDLDWDGLCEGDALAVLDEAQAWPEVFPRLRGAIDAGRKRMGRFLLLGSVAPSLMREVSESLAGRVSLLHLGPMVQSEVSEVGLDTLWLRGGFPEPLLRSTHDPSWHRSFLDLLAQRDLPDWGLPSKPRTTQRLFKMLGAVHGQTLNASQLGKSLGLTYNTVRTYIDFLVGAFLLRELPVFAGNVKKRLVKSPKIYWADSGLLHALMGVENREQLLSQPWVGSSWEGFVVQQILGSLESQGIDAAPSFFQTSDGYELDLVLRHQGLLWAIEVKLTSQPSEGDLRRLTKTADMINADRRVLLSRTRNMVEQSGSLSCDLPTFLPRLLKTD